MRQNLDSGFVVEHSERVKEPPRVYLERQSRAKRIRSSREWMCGKSLSSTEGLGQANSEYADRRGSVSMVQAASGNGQFQ